ncbi:MAG: class I SAM-dependent methyltransferase [Actinomycetales bacterium]
MLASHRSRTAANSAGYLLEHLGPGMRILDIGSGPGTITCDLAEIVAPGGGRVTAVEISDAALDLTRREAAKRGVRNLDLMVGDIHRLDLPNDGFDVVHAHQVLQHVPNPVAALREMIRVARAGGIVAARDSDYAAFTWFPDEPALTRWLALYDQLARQAGGEPNAGRHYRRWARAAGLIDVTITSSSWCYADDNSVDWWAGVWAERVLASDFRSRAEGAGVRLDELEGLSRGWRRWAGHPDALFTVPSVELLAVTDPPAQRSTSDIIDSL